MWRPPQTYGGRPPKPNLIGRLFGAVKRRIEARYEAAYQLWGERSWLPASVQDARFDADPSTRLEIIRRARYWERNNGIVNRLCDLFEQFTVGPTGLRLIPTSEDEEWNTSASAWWQGWCRFCDLVSLQTFGELQALIARTWFIDGEVFILKTYSPDTHRPRIQLIEGHRVATPMDKRGEEGRTVIDGVAIDAKGRPTGYYVRRASNASAVNPLQALPPFSGGTLSEDFDLVPAEQMIHVFEPQRTGMYRGLSFLTPVMNDLHDLDDLQFAEMKATKAAADLAVIYITRTGEPTNSSSFRRQTQNLQTQDAKGNPTTQTNSVWYDVTQTGRDKYLKPGESASLFQSNRPSVATQQHWDYLTSKICAGVGISKLLVMPYSNQGTVVRSDLDVNAQFFRSRSAVIARICREIYLFAISWAKDFDRSMDGKIPADWASVTVRPPRSVNVDIGRNSNAMLAELEAGTRTLSDICAENGDDWREVLEQKAREAAFKHKMAAKYGINISEISVSNPEPDPEPEETPVSNVA